MLLLGSLGIRMHTANATPRAPGYVQEQVEGIFWQQLLVALVVNKSTACRHNRFIANTTEVSCIEYMLQFG